MLLSIWLSHAQVKIKKKRPPAIESIEIQFVLREHGWMDLQFSFSNLRLEVHLSSVFDPIPAIVEWLTKISEDVETSSVEIDEEGLFKRFFFEKYQPLDQDLYELRIVSDRDGSFHEYEIRKIVSRAVFLQKFRSALMKLAQDAIGRDWAPYDLSEYLLKNVKNEIEES